MNESLFEFETLSAEEQAAIDAEINEEVGLTSIDRYRGLANFAGQGQSNVPNKQMLQHSPIGTLNGKQLLYGEELANGAPRRVSANHVTNYIVNSRRYFQDKARSAIELQSIQTRQPVVNNEQNTKNAISCTELSYPLQFRVAQNIARNRSDLIFSQSEQPNAFPLNIVDRVDNRNVNARYLAATTGYRQPNPTNLVREPTNEVITEPFRIGRNEHNYRSSDFAPFHNIEPQFRNDIDRRGDILKI